VQIEGKLSAKGKVSDVPYIYSSRSVLLSLTIFSVKKKKKKILFYDLVDFVVLVFRSHFIIDKMIQMDGGDRLRVTLLDRMSTVENGRSSVTLEDILMAETSSFRSLTTPTTPVRNHSSSSLLDVMRRERRRDKTAWKSLRDKLRLKRTATGWISSNPIPTLDNHILTPDNDSHRFNRLGFLLTNSETNRSSRDVSDAAEEAAEREGRLRLGTVLAAEREVLVCIS